MNKGEIEATVVRLLGNIAPEADFASLGPNEDIRDALDIDSMDFLNFAIALHEVLGVDIPEADYPKLVTLTRAVEYLGKKMASNPG